MDLTILQDEVLLATLPEIEFDGWTPRALQRGAERSGHGRAGVVRGFPDGIVQLADHFADWADRQMLGRIVALGPDWEAMRTRDKVAFALRARFETLEPHREAVRRLAGLALEPSAAARLARAGWRTADRVWRAAGDQATDLNHYTKRALLGLVQSATLLAWLSDRSEDRAEVWAFLDRRIAAVLKVGRTLGGGLGRLSPVLEAPWRLAGRLRYGRARAAAAGPVP